MKSSARVTLLFVSLLLTGTPVLQAQTGAPHVFHDPALGYSVSYGDDCQFEVNAHKGSDRTEWWIESLHKDKGTKWTLDLAVAPLTTNPDTRLEAQEMAAELKRSFPGLKVVHDPTLFPSLLDTWWFDWQVKKNQGVIHGAQYLDLSPRQQRLYVFTASAPSAMFSTWKPEWERIVATLKFD